VGVLEDAIRADASEAVSWFLKRPRVRMSALKCCHHLVPPSPPRSRPMTVVLPPLVPQLPSPESLFASPTLLSLSRLHVRPSGRPIHLVHAVRSTHMFIPDHRIHVYTGSQINSL